MHFSWNFIQGAIFPFSGSGSNIISLLAIDSNSNIKPEANNFVLLSVTIEFLIIYFISVMWNRKNYSQYIGI